MDGRAAFRVLTEPLETGVCCTRLRNADSGVWARKAELLSAIGGLSERL